MIRTPETCIDRETTIDPSIAVCHLLARFTGISDPAVCTVRRDACDACCASLRSPDQMNPVIASLMFNVATGIARNGGHSDCSAERARSLLALATDQLSVLVKEQPEQSFPPSFRCSLESKSADENATTTHAGRTQQFQWATAMLTAPRRDPRIESTIESLIHAGFENIHIFAEPGAWIPEKGQSLRITHRPRRFGNFLNFYSCLCTLLEESPNADAYAVFQDDIQLAAGLRSWCEEQLWPLDTGIVSLFTPRLHSERTKGWHLKTPGFQRVCGAQALIFRRDRLQEFLSDAQVINSIRLRERADDAVLGGWIAREGLRIAYHTPSLVQHVGAVSAMFPGHPDQRNLANFVDSVSAVETWTPPQMQTGRLGIVGWNTPTGLGSINRDLARHLMSDRWLAPPHPTLGGSDEESIHNVKVTTSLPTRAEQDQWFSEIDWLIFAERPYVGFVPEIAAHAGNGIACIPMWEWIRPDLRWLQFVDVMICPTLHTFRLMEDWTQRYGFGWKSVYVPWPIDSDRFEFRQRHICREFLFINGWGGGHATRVDGQPVGYDRKGLELIVAAACLAPDLRFVVRSLNQLPPRLPKNIQAAPALVDNDQLYDEGDVCVQPSHYEGLGLQLLECQAAGMPLITTDAAPMNEANPFRTIPTCGQEVVNVGGNFISSERLTAEALVATLRPLVGMDIRDASRKARHYIESCRNWNSARQIILAELARR